MAPACTFTIFHIECRSKDTVKEDGLVKVEGTLLAMAAAVQTEALIHGLVLRWPSTREDQQRPWW